jgi:hypothetical protein
MYNENYYNAAANSGYPSCASTAGQCPCSYKGCMDPNMQHYDPSATCDDGTCVGWVVGCMDPNSFNYSPTATQDDGSCIARTFGCTTANAHNFDPTANTDDGSCIAKVGGCADPNAYNYNQAANRDCNDNPIGGGNNQQSFSGYNNASGREGDVARTIRANDRAGWTTTGVISCKTDNDYGGKGGRLAKMCNNEGLTTPSRDGGYMRPIVYDNYTGDEDWDAVRGTDRGRASSRSQFSRPPVYPPYRGKFSGDGEYDGDIYRNLTERHHLKPQKKYGHPTAPLSPVDTSFRTGDMSGLPGMTGMTRMSESYPGNGGGHARYGTGQGLATGSSGRTADWEVDGDIYRNASGNHSNFNEKGFGGNQDAQWFNA